MSFDPTTLISLIQNCKTLYDYSSDVKHSSAERRQLLDEVHSLQSHLEALQELAKTPGIAGDQASMGQLASLLDSSQPFNKVVKETLRTVEVALGRRMSDPEPNELKVLWWRVIAALWWTVDKAEVTLLFADLERYKSRIALALQHDMFKQQNVINRQLDNMNHHISNEDRLKIAEFISESDYAGHRIHLLEKRLSETGSWMIKHPEFVAWRDNEESPRTLWCYGHPGAGKSVMAALIVDHLQSTSKIVLSVFCRYSSDKFPTPFAVLRGLLRQLIEKTTKVPSPICDLYWTKTTPNPETLPDFLAEAAAIHAQPIYIVIDALDECDIGIDMLCAVEQLGPKFRVLVTSRPVFQEIEEYPSIEIRASDEDILTAVDTTLLKLRHPWLDEELKSTIRAKVVEKADGMFLLASLQLRELQRDITCRRDVVDILHSLPRSLDDAYKLTFQRIRKQGERKLELACRALALIVLHSPFLETIHVQHLLAKGDTTRYTNIETILQCCQGLLHENGATVVIMHYSVSEYTALHWSELFPEHPNRIEFCLKLGHTVLTRIDKKPTIDRDGYKSEISISVWHAIVREMRKPEELKQVISLLSASAVTKSLFSARTARESLLSAPATRESLARRKAKYKPLARDPLLIACYFGYSHVMQYLIQKALPDVRRFNDALRVSSSGHLSEGNTKECIEYINARPDMDVNEQGVVVGKRSRRLSEFYDDETFADRARHR